MHSEQATNRRNFLRQAFAGSAGLIALGTPALSLAAEDKEAPVYPPEDLMQEHGLLNRVLLVYDEVNRRLAAKEAFDSVLLARSAGIIHSFIEGYHEQLEEHHIFPRLQKAGKLVSLVHVLQQQHVAGRKVTARILALSKPGALKTDDDRRRLAEDLTAFTRMYRPHEAREDTVVFPTFRSVVTSKELEDLGERFEAIEHQKFGREGFEGMVAKVAEIETQLGIGDLTKFTPR